MKTYICKHCDTENRWRYDTSNKFCDRECFKLFYKNPENSVKWFSCINCGISKLGVRNNQKYCGSKCQVTYEYANGLRDKSTIVKAAHEKIRQNGFPQKRGKKIPHLHNTEIYAKVSKGKTGKRVPKQQGKYHWNWKGGVDKGIWFTWEYQSWRKAVYERDNYTCQECGDNKGGNLEAHHIKPRILYPELTFDINNGQTLCHNCHIKTPTYGMRVLAVR